MLDRIRIVLVNTSHPGNIGSCARAMKTMGLSQLYLVSPQDYPHPKSQEMASGADDILTNAIVVDSLATAIAPCHLVVGTSARIRTVPWPLMSPRAIAEKIRNEPEQNEIAVVFGREQSGLTNAELQCCHLHVQIPANPAYSSLNIAAALQVIAYELRVASLAQEINDEINMWDYRQATAAEMERFFEHLENVLIEIDFLKANAPRKLMTRLKRLFYRTRPDVMEMNILRGLLSAVQETIHKSPQKEDGDGKCRINHLNALSQ